MKVEVLLMVDVELSSSVLVVTTGVIEAEVNRRLSDVIVGAERLVDIVLDPRSRERVTGEVVIFTEVENSPCSVDDADGGDKSLAGSLGAPVIADDCVVEAEVRILSLRAGDNVVSGAESCVVAVLVDGVAGSEISGVMIEDEELANVDENSGADEDDTDDAVLAGIEFTVVVVGAD